MTLDDMDPVLTLLAGLRAPRPTAAFEDRVRRRCHDVIGQQVRHQQLQARPLVQRTADVALVGVLCGYAMVALIEATQVTARVLGLH